MILDESKSICEKHQKIIVSEENKRKHVANNDDGNLVRHFRIDGGIVPASSSVLRCDYLVINLEKKNAYPIELKGTDVKHAVDQIRSTITYLGSELSLYTILPRIIYNSNTHGVRDSKVRSLKNDYPGCVIKTNTYEEKI